MYFIADLLACLTGCFFIWHRLFTQSKFTNKCLQCVSAKGLELLQILVGIKSSSSVFTHNICLSDI